MKSPKVEDLEFEPRQAFENLKNVGRAVLAVPKSRIENGRVKLRKKQKPSH